jgi:hypothetical protein
MFIIMHICVTLLMLSPVLVFSANMLHVSLWDDYAKQLCDGIAASDDAQ